MNTENASLNTENASLETELEGAQSDLADLQADYANLNAAYNESSADYEAVSNELAEIKGVYPPRDFSSLQELQDWLYSNDVSERPITTTADRWYSRALELQEAALADGYLVSVDVDGPDEEDRYNVWCIAIIDGYIWYWDPETDEPYDYSSFGRVK